MLQKIAAGGMGTVYLAEHERQHGFRKLVAIKLLHPHLEVGEEAQQRFTVEARIGASLAHPNIVSVHDLDTGDDGGLFFVMEYVHGCSLRTLMNAQRGPLPPPEAALIVRELLRGLHAAHTFVDQSGSPWPVIHRDVNPKNVLVSDAGAVKLTDFGIAKIFDQQITVATGLRGTISYMSPEQARGEPVDPRTDVYSCGVILYELLLHRRAIEGGGQMERLAAAQRGVALDEPALHGAGVPEPLRRLLAQALAPDRERRLASAEAMLHPLEAYLTAAGTPPPRAVAARVAPHVAPMDALEEPTVTRVTATAARAGAPPARATPSALDATLPPLPPPRPRRRSAWVLVVAILAAGALAALATLLATGGGTESAVDARTEDLSGSATDLRPPDRAAVGPERPAADAGRAVDAGHAVDARHTVDARGPRPKVPTRRRRPRRTGRLLFNTVPRWSVVWVDGRRRGNTPLDLRLTAGRHRLVARPLGTGRPLRLTVRIGAGKTTRKVLTVSR